MKIKSNSIPFKLIRGGTSKGVYINESDFTTTNKSDQIKILLSILGSPDKYKMQLNGLGSGISSTSKVALLSKVKKEGKFYLNYNFGQVSVTDSIIDFSGTCGNLASGLIEYFKHSNLYDDCIGTSDKITNNDYYKNVIRVWDNNKDSKINVYGNIYDTVSDTNQISISGVTGKFEPVYVEFLQGKTKSKLFPTENFIDIIELGSNKKVEVTLIYGPNPLVIMNLDSILKIKNLEITPKNDIIKNYSKYSDLIEEIRLKASELMKCKLSESLRVVFASEPFDYIDHSNQNVAKEDYDIYVLITASGRIHHAITGTGAINLSYASKIQKTLLGRILSITGKTVNKTIRFGHPSGVMTCDSELELANDIYVPIKSGFVRNAKLICEGIAYY